MYDRSPYDEARRGGTPAGPHLVRPGEDDGAREKGRAGEEKALPLPGWLVKLYFIFPIILYIPDAIFNYFVYSDGVGVAADDNPVLAVGKTALWAFMSIGIVGMAYLLSVLAPWHWVQGHRIQAFFCGVGVVIATGITTWNSLAYRSTGFQAFATDRWAYGIWPELQEQHVSVTMIIAAVAPPFWGLFWAIVQPTQTRKSLAHLAENHAERMMRLQQEAEMKALKAETAAKVREAQLRGMAATASAAREQVGVVAAQWRGGRKQDGKGDGGEQGSSTDGPPVERAHGTMGRESQVAARGDRAVRPSSASPAPRGGDPRVGDPIAAQGMQPPEVTDPMQRLARAASTLQPATRAGVAPAAPAGAPARVGRRGGGQGRAE